MRQNINRLISIILTTCILMAFTGCANTSSNFSPEAMANEVCNCFEKAKSYQNDKRRMDEILNCTNLMESKLSEIQKIGVRNDWSNDSVRNATKRFDDIVEKCW